MTIILKIGRACIEKRRGQFECRSVPMNMSNQRMHWVIRHKWMRAWKNEVLGTLKITPVKDRPDLPLEQPNITIEIQHLQFFDQDGAYNAVKPLLDGLKECGVIIDDGPQYINLKVEQKKVAHRAEEKTIIKIN